MKRLILPALLACAACGTPPVDANKDGIADGIQTPNTVSVVAPVSPVGTVSGQVLDTRFQPLEGVNVSLATGGTPAVFAKTTSTADGAFNFAGVPAGASVTLLLSKVGFGAVRLTTSVPAAAGQFPLDNGNANVGPVLLTTLDGTHKFSVLAATGKPAKGVKALLEVTPAGLLGANASGYGPSLGVTSAEATADDSGVLTFTGVPGAAELARIGGSAVLSVAPWDEDGDGRPDFRGQAQTFSGSTLYTTPNPLLVLSDLRSTLPLAVQYSNLDSLATGGTTLVRNQLRSTDLVWFAFNQQIAEASLTVKVVGEDCGAVVATAKPTVRNGMVVSVAPQAAGGWDKGKEHNIEVRATSLESGRALSVTGFFFAADLAAPSPLGTTGQFLVKKAAGSTMGGALQAGDELFVIFDSSITNLTAGAPARLFVNFDLNSNGSTGTATGDQAEYGAPFSTGWPLASAELLADPTVGTFACVASNYTPRYRVSVTSSLPSSGVPLGTAVKVTFARDNSTSTGFQTIWGQPVSGEVSGTLTALP